MRPATFAAVVLAGAVAAGGAYLFVEAGRPSAPSRVGGVIGEAAPSPPPPPPSPPPPPIAIAPRSPPRPPVPRAPPRPPVIEAPPPVVEAPLPVQDAPVVTTATGLQYQDTRVGDGPEPTPGQTVIVHYTGWLDDGGRNGRQVDSSRERGEPMSFPFGKRVVIAGWEEGLASMRVGGQRTLVIPASLGYGERGAGAIPGGATLRFEVELLEVRDP